MLPPPLPAAAAAAAACRCRCRSPHTLTTHCAHFAAAKQGTYNPDTAAHCWPADGRAAAAVFAARARRHGAPQRHCLQPAAAPSLLMPIMLCPAVAAMKHAALAHSAPSSFGFLFHCSFQTPPQVLVNFGSSWCHHCHQMFPHFLSLSKQFPQLKYAVAQVRKHCSWPGGAWQKLRGVELRARAAACCASFSVHSCSRAACLQGMHAHRQPPPSVSHPQVDYMHEETKGITYTPTFALYKQGRKVRRDELSARRVVRRGCRLVCAMQACLCYSPPAADCRASNFAMLCCATLCHPCHAALRYAGGPVLWRQRWQFYLLDAVMCCAVLRCAGGPVLWGQRAAAAGPPVALDAAARRQKWQKWLRITVVARLNCSSGWRLAATTASCALTDTSATVYIIRTACCHSLALAARPCSQHCTCSHLIIELA